MLFRSPIGTNLPGLDICELLPAHAKVMDKCTVIRSFSHGNGDHWAAAHWMLTGRTGATGGDRKPRYPSMGAVASHLLGPKVPGALAAVNMNDGGFGFHGAAWLGVNHNPLQCGSFSYGNEAGSLPTSDAKSFALADGLSERRLIDRVSLRGQLDAALKDALFSPIDWRGALYMFPSSKPSWLRVARSVERFGVKTWPTFAGVIVVEATKQLYQGIPQRYGNRIRLAPVFRPAWAGRTAAASADGVAISPSEPTSA